MTLANKKRVTGDFAPEGELQKLTLGQNLIKLIAYSSDVAILPF